MCQNFPANVAHARYFYLCMLGFRASFCSQGTEQRSFCTIHWKILSQSSAPCFWAQNEVDWFFDFDEVSPDCTPHVRQFLVTLTTDIEYDYSQVVKNGLSLVLPPVTHDRWWWDLSTFQTERFHMFRAQVRLEKRKNDRLSAGEFFHPDGYPWPRESILGLTSGQKFLLVLLLINCRGRNRCGRLNSGAPYE